MLTQHRGRTPHTNSDHARRRTRLGETAESCSPGAGTPVDESDHVHGPAVEVQGLFTLPLAEAREAFEATLPRYFG